MELTRTDAVFSRIAMVLFLCRKQSSRIDQEVYGEFLFLHKNDTMAVLLKTASVRASSIQIMQIRVQNKGKSVWKSRYDGDGLKPLLVLKQFS